MNSYSDKKSIYDEEKKALDKLNASIKELMTEYDLTEYEGDNATVTCTVSDTEKMNEDKLLEVIKQKIWAGEDGTACPFIKTVEQVDFDALEKAIYNGDISKEQLVEIGKCKEVKSVTTLRIKKKKVTK